MKHVKTFYRLLALTIVAVLLLSGCSRVEKTPDTQVKSDKLTLLDWKGTEGFIELVGTACPDIELEIIPYAGANRTGYSWAQMRMDDIPDVFITNSFVSEELASEKLVDLSGYDFVNDLTTALLDQVAVDGGIYVLPTNNTMYGMYYNKTLMEEHGWEVPTNFAELEALCAEITAAGFTPGILSTKLTGNPFAVVFNLAKTDWLTTPAGTAWERDFLAGDATATGMWEGTMEYAQRYQDLGMFHTDPDDLDVGDLVEKYMASRRAVFLSGAWVPGDAHMSNGDAWGMMPYIGEDGSKNIYMYSPSSYIGLSKKLLEPGNEKKLENAVRLLALLFSPEGQATMVSEATPTVMSALGQAELPEDSLIYDAQKAMSEGRAFLMTYAHWEGVLSDIGQGFKEWFRDENGMSATDCITLMDNLQSEYLHNRDTLYFCNSEGDFTVEETAELVGKAMGTAVGADAAMVPYATTYQKGVDMKALVTGKLYAAPIDIEISNAIAPGLDGEYALMTMTGAQAKELAAAGFAAEGAAEPFPYVLVTKGGGELEDDVTYQVVFLMHGYTSEVAEQYHARVEKGSLRTYLREWFTGQKTVSPDGNPWN